MHSVCIVTMIQTQSKYQSKIMGEKYMYVRETEKEREREKEREEEVENGGKCRAKTDSPFHGRENHCLLRSMLFITVKVSTKRIT